MCRICHSCRRWMYRTRGLRLGPSRTCSPCCNRGPPVSRFSIVLFSTTQLIMRVSPVDESTSQAILWDVIAYMDALLTSRMAKPAADFFARVLQVLRSHYIFVADETPELVPVVGGEALAGMWVGLELFAWQFVRLLPNGDVTPRP